MNNCVRLIQFAASLFCCVSISLQIDAAEDVENRSIRQLGDLSLEELMQRSVTSVYKKETLLQNSPAAVTVLTEEDIRRSGATSIPELLRMVPGMDVARINENEWAISARGFNSQYATKLLVLVDGRSVYTPTFSGVYWNVVDTVLEDLDRIEVIRGPGASLWGANAVNGVVNIVTKSAKETQGVLVSSIYGTEDQPTTSLRYGGKLSSNVYYRVYAKYQSRDNFPTSSTVAAADDSRALRGGVRLDWDASERDLLTFQTEYYRGEYGQDSRAVLPTPPFSFNYPHDNENFGLNLNGRWTRKISEESELTVQSYYDDFQHVDSGVIEQRTTFNFEIQHNFPLGERQNLMWGAGFRYTRDHLTGSPSLTYTPERFQENLYNIFLQDEISLVPEKLKFTLGSKFEHNGYSGFEVQPSGRLAWTPTEKQTVWSSISRAVRTPARWDTHARLDLYGYSDPSGVNVVSLMGNPRAKSEELTAYEIGYRIAPASKLSFEVNGFYNVYDHLFLYEPAKPFKDNTPSSHTVHPSVFQNHGYGVTYGGELSAEWHPINNFKLIAGYSLLLSDLHPAGSPDLGEGNNPQNQFHLRSYLNLGKKFELNGAFYYVDSLKQQRVPSYIRMDAGLVWHITKSLDFGIWGQNLSGNQHLEFTSFNTPLQTEVPRNIFAKITWQF